jgi:hypothetical protein
VFSLLGRVLCIGLCNWHVAKAVSSARDITGSILPGHRGICRGWTCIKNTSLYHISVLIKVGVTLTSARDLQKNSRKADLDFYISRVAIKRVTDSLVFINSSYGRVQGLI